MRNINFKIQVHQQCTTVVLQRINELKAILHEAQEAANNETKSSAGDKHETGRAMAQLETEKLTGQLTEALKLEQALTKIDPNIQHQQIGLGSLVTTNNGIFYLSVGLGKIELEGQTVFVISAVSPIGKLLLNKKEGCNLQPSFNGIQYVIESVS